MTSVAVHQYTYQHAGPRTQHAGPSCGLFGTHRTSVAVLVCLCVSVSTHSTSVAVHQWAVCSVHTGRPWSAHTGHPWVSISTHISTLVHGLSTLALPMDCSSDFGPRGLSVQYTHDVRGCPSAHTGRPCASVSTHRTSVAVRVCLCVSVCVRQHTHDVCGCPSVHISPRCPFLWTVWLILSHVGCLFNTQRTSVGVRQHTRDVCGCPWLPVSTHRTSVAVRVCQSVHTGRPWLSISTHISTLVLGLSTLALPMDSSGDFGPSGLFVQYTQDVRGCPSAHTGCPCVSVSTHMTSVCVRVCPSAHTGCPWLSISTHISTLVLGLSTLTLPMDCSGDFGPRELSVQYTQDVRGFPPAHTGRLWLSVCVRVCSSVSVSTHRTSMAFHHTHRTSVGVRQHTSDVRGCLCVSVCVRLCPSAYTGRLWLSISTHISTLVLGLSTLALPVDCWGDFGPRGLSVQYTQDVRGCPPAHTGRPWLSVAIRQHTQDVRGSLCVSISTHLTSVAVHHTHTTSVGVRQHTQDVRVRPSAHTGRPWLSLCVCVCPSAHTGRLWLSISTHISTLVLGLSMLTLPVDCLGDFGPRGLSVQYTQDVRGCPASTHMTSVAVCGCPTHISTLVHGLSTLALPVDCSGDFGPRGLSVQYTHDVRGCPSAHTRRPCASVSTHRTSVAVRVCLCVSVSTHTHQAAQVAEHFPSIKKDTSSGSKQLVTSM
ncbi:hypothetical protein YC2023_066364 [Brassica napus]